MVQSKAKYDCCGCAACSIVCSHKAIAMQADAMGFLYPKVDSAKCVDCGLCDKLCPFNNPLSQIEPGFNQLAFAARNVNNAEVATSRSGGVFIALSNYILGNGGVVYGAGFETPFKVAHKRALSAKERNEFKGSKYTQSDIRGMFQQVKSDLKDGRYVLFSGTPCQVAGLKSSLGRVDISRLFLIDIVCHGVSSPKVWEDYLHYLERKTGDRIVSADFRDKGKYGWDGLHRESFVFEHKGKRTFHVTFYQPFLLRPSCHKCPFTSLDRVSDVTIGDLWGWEKAAPDMNDDKMGCNLVLCNTQKGLDWFKDSSKELHQHEIDINLALQPNLQRPTEEDPLRAQFESDFAQYGFDYVRSHYWDSEFKTLVRRFKNKIKRIFGLR